MLFFCLLVHPQPSSHTDKRDYHTEVQRSLIFISKELVREGTGLFAARKYKEAGTEVTTPGHGGVSQEQR
jgi:hypothetical protein